jgi:hypothetical protein
VSFCSSKAFSVRVRVGCVELADNEFLGFGYGRVEGSSEPAAEGWKALVGGQRWEADRGGRGS